jgi:hypothetical protein
VAQDALDLWKVFVALLQGFVVRLLVFLPWQQLPQLFMCPCLHTRAAVAPRRHAARRLPITGRVVGEAPHTALKSRRCKRPNTRGAYSQGACP